MSPLRGRSLPTARPGAEPRARRRRCHIAAGTPIEVVSELLGHTSIGTTRRYAQVVEPLKERAAETMDWLLRGD